MVALNRPLLLATSWSLMPRHSRPPPGQESALLVPARTDARAGILAVVVDDAGGRDLQDLTGLAVHAGVGPGLGAGHLDLCPPGARAVQSPTEEDPGRDGHGDADHAPAPPPPAGEPLPGLPGQLAGPLHVGDDRRVGAVAELLPYLGGDGQGPGQVPAPEQLLGAIDAVARGPQLRGPPLGGVPLPLPGPPLGRRPLPLLPLGGRPLPLGPLGLFLALPLAGL